MQESLTKFKQIFELSPDPVLIIKEGLFVECNDAAVKMMKAKSKEQLLQVLPSEISPLMQPEGKKSFDKAQEMFAEVEKNGVARFNWLHTKFDRSVLDVEVTLARMEINDEILLYVHWKDLTTQKELELALQESKNNLQEVQKMSNIGHWELDLVDGTLYWSDEVYRIFGLQPQEFGATYEAFLQYIHPDDHDLVNKAYADSIQNKSSYHIVHRVLTKQNELKYVEERCIHQYDEDKNVIRSIGTVHDITKRVIYEKELELAANVFKYATDSIVITDADNQIISVNGAYERLTLYSMEDVIGKNPRVLSSGWGDKEFY